MVKHLLISKWTKLGKWELLLKILFITEKGLNLLLLLPPLQAQYPSSSSFPFTLIAVLAATGFSLQINMTIYLIINRY